MRTLHLFAFVLMLLSVSVARADVWADEVYDSVVGPGYSGPLEHGVGAPDWSWDPLIQWDASTGDGGYVTYRFVDNVISEVSGNDFAIWLGTADGVQETGELFVSNDGANFHYVGLVTDGIGTSPIGPLGFDIAGTGLMEVRFVKLVDVVGDNDAVDIDAVGAIPEPATVTLVAVAGVAMLRRRDQRK